MEKHKRKVLISKYSVLFCITVAAWCLLEVGGEFHAALSFFKNMETEIDGNSYTSADFRYEKRFQDTLGHYRFFGSLYQPEYSAPVPGLESTDILGKSCGQMVPQGICIANDYMLVTAYDNGNPDKKRAGRHSRNPSVLYVLSNSSPEDRELLATIVLPDINHVGGIAFDGKNIWIAKSVDRQCSVISYDVVQKAVNSGKSSYELSSYEQNVYCGAVASFVTWHKGRLWVGTYSNRISGNGMLRSYAVEKKQTEEGEVFALERQEEVVIPGFANGAAFIEIGEKTYLAITASKGRYFDSEIYFYDVVKDCFTGRNLYHFYDSWKFPPMAEELVCDGRNTYFLFESAATCYSAPIFQRCSYPVDRIYAVFTSELFQRNMALGPFHARKEIFCPELLYCLPASICSSRRKKHAAGYTSAIVRMFQRQNVDNARTGELYCNQQQTGGKEPWSVFII